MTALAPARFLARHAAELGWYFGEGLAAVIPSGIDYAAKKESFRTGKEPVYDLTDGDLLARFGRVDRALYALPRPYEHVLGLAHGDAGEVATLRGLRRDLRWRAVGHLTPIAGERAPHWLAALAGAVPAGDPRLAWAEDLYARVGAGEGGRVALVYHELERQAAGLLAEGEALFAAALDGILGRERAIAHTSRARASAGAP